MFEPTARAASVEPVPIRIRSAVDVDPGIDAFAKQPNVGLMAAAEVGAVTYRVPIIDAVARHHMPAVYQFRFFATDGGLAAYGVSLVDQFRRAASYVDRILRGTNPSELPVQAPDIRIDPQSQDRESAGHSDFTGAARPRRRGD